ncbi:MAG: cell wall-binding repeat-containing protein [Euzebya sp.]
MPSPWSRLVLLVLAAAMVPATFANGTPRPEAVDNQPLSAPEGGPVDDGWLPGETSQSGFTQFEGEPAPAGSPIWPGVRHDVRATTVGAGLPVNVQILNLDPGAPVTIHPTLALGSVRGLAPVTAQSGDPLAGSVAAVNGGFWLRDPLGEPNGFFAGGGQLISDAESQGVGPRGAVGWTADGRLLVDRIDTTETLTLADGMPLVIDGINRGHREFDEFVPDGIHSLLSYTSDYGGTVVVIEPRQPQQDPPPPPVDLAVIRISVAGWPITGSTTGTVIGISRDAPGAFTPEVGEVLIVGTGSGAAHLDGVQDGDMVTVSTQIRALDPSRDADWAQIVRGLAGGPMIVKNAQMTAPGDWVSEGFEPQIHSDVRAPRTAIGVTADGRTLMVTADGRRPGITHGFTIAELARYMIALGAVEAVSLDGGGSSQMVTDGILRNVPCCEQIIRPVATSLQVTHTEPFDGTDRLRGPGRVDTAVAIARHAYPDGADAAVLAVASAAPDALAGGPLASAEHGPLLLTATDALPSVTADALEELGVSRVSVLGGTQVLGSGVVAALAARGITVVRLAGESRFETAAAIAEAVKRDVRDVSSREVDRAFIVSSDGFADALVAAGPGGILQMPILLNGRDQLHPATARALEGLDEVVLVGGTARLSEGLAQDLANRGFTVTRLAGDGRYGTARAVNEWLAGQTDLGTGMVLATGNDFPDALAGGPLAALRRVPLMIVPAGSLYADPDSAAVFNGLTPRDTIDVLGGLGVISSYQQWQAEQLTQQPQVEDCLLPLLDTC